MAYLFLIREVHGAPLEAGWEVEGRFADVHDLFYGAFLGRLDFGFGLLCGG